MTEPAPPLSEIEECFRLMVETVTDYAIFMLDVDGNVVSWNAGAERIKGYPSEEIIGQHFSVFYPPDDIASGNPAAELQTAASTGRLEYEAWRVRKDGSRFWANVVIIALRDPDGGLQGFAKVTRDVTERMRFQEHLGHQARIFDCVSDAVIATDENFVLTAWNRGAERLYGWSAEEVVGRATIDVLGTEMPKAARDEILSDLVTGEEWRGEVVQRHKDGSPVIVEAAAIGIVDGPTRIVTVNRDIADARRATIDQERNRLARELHDSVSQALFSMTLQARALELALEQDGRDRDGPVGQGVTNIRELTQGALAEMRALIFELRPGALAEEGLAVALNKYAAAVEAKEGISIEVSVASEWPSSSPETEENLYRLTQEALTNVVKHAAATTVRIRLAPAGRDRVELEIADDGTGFDTALNRPGHLGLRTMSERADILGGYLEIISAPGGGTTVRVTVPASRERPPSGNPQGV